MEIVLATTNRAKLTYFNDVFARLPEHSISPLPEGIQHEPEKGTEPQRAYEKARRVWFETGKPAFGWDDGIYTIGSGGELMGFPGPDVNSTFAHAQTKQQLLQAYVQHFEQLAEPAIVFKRSFCLVRGESHEIAVFHTWLQTAHIDTSRTAEFDGTDYPFSFIAKPQGCNSPYAFFTEEERKRYNSELSGHMQVVLNGFQQAESGIGNLTIISAGSRHWPIADPNIIVLRGEDGQVALSRNDHNNCCWYTDLKVEESLINEALLFK
jgi:inosine/xanthosine triphosphate pyrophosphatase family protein